MNRILNCWLLVLLVVMFSCATIKMNPIIRNYVEAALDTIKLNALNGAKLNWDSVKRNALYDARRAKVTEDTYTTINNVLYRLGDNHSFLQKNNKNLTYPENLSNRTPSPYGTRMKIEFGIHELNSVKVARIFVPQGRRNDKFAQQLQDIICELANEKPCGWIVDLRGNGGGDIWPMIAGIGHLVGENPLGGSINGNGEMDFYIYENGFAKHLDKNGNKTTYSKVSESTFQGDRYQPLAILIDRGTASSGEGLAIILKGRKNTRSFGEMTYGASTATKGFQLSDNLNMVLAVSSFQDRNGNVYQNGVEPNTMIPIGTNQLDPNNDPIIEAAINWIINYGVCK
jgi:carboxyl-terminal processing protease